MDERMIKTVRSRESEANKRIKESRDIIKQFVISYPDWEDYFMPEEINLIHRILQG